MRSPGSARLARDVLAALGAVLIARLAINGGIRVVYPFLPEIARGLGVSVAVVAALIAVRSLTGIAAPLVARAAERVGRRALMLAGLTAATAGALLVVAAPALAPGGSTALVLLAAGGFIAAGVAKPLFDVPMQGWFGDRVPYAQRARVLGITELTWALSLLVTVPLAGLLIPRLGWQSTFASIIVLGALGIVAVRQRFEPDRPVARTPRPLHLTGPRVRLLAVVVVCTVASELMFVVYGSWLAHDLGLTVTAIGLVAFLLVAAELTGEGGVALFADRWGVKRTIVVGLGASAVCYAAFGLVGTNIVAALAVLTLWILTFEVTFVATVPLMSELAAESRDRLLSLMVMAVAVARAVGALTGPWLYAAGGIALSGLSAALLALVALALARGVEEPASLQ